MIVLRHALSVSRKQWDGDDDRQRPLTATGRRQAERLVPVLAAYDVRRLVTSSSTRCVQTRWRRTPRRPATSCELEDVFSEEDHSPKAVKRLVAELVGGARRVAGGARAGW